MTKIKTVARLILGNWATGQLGKNQNCGPVDFGRWALGEVSAFVRCVIAAYSLRTFCSEMGTGMGSDIAHHHLSFDIKGFYRMSVGDSVRQTGLGSIGNEMGKKMLPLHAGQVLHAPRRAGASSTYPR